MASESNSHQSTKPSGKITAELVYQVADIVYRRMQQELRIEQERRRITTLWERQPKNRKG